ncbi:Maf-like protein [Candidatus Gottesmanbacteria bacterium]|nr:Maf-like protein [Candidatus Gottesmanbacteria bacterium]
MQLILASASEGRKKLLSLLKIPFKIMPSSLDEEIITGKTPVETLNLRAKLKGEEVVKKIIQSANKQITQLVDIRPTTYYSHPLSYLIISADSEAILDGKLIGKPKSYQEAKEIFFLLSGKTHELATAIYIIRLLKQPKTRSDLVKRWWEGYDRSFVTFRKLSPEDINRYLSITDYKRYTGGYALFSAQDFISKIEGSLSNVIGLPLEKVIPILRKNRLL